MYVVNSVNKSYGKKNILKNVSMSIPPGCCAALLGINGSGKSTLFGILAGSIKADSGSFGFDDGGSLALLPQDNPLLPELTALDNIRLWHGGGRRQIMSGKNGALFAKLGVDKFLNERVSGLSGGMKKRLSLAITMLSEPDLLLLDEPLASLDMLCQNVILTYIREFVQSGGSAVIATHETSALDICNRIYTLKNGCLSLSLCRKPGEAPAAPGTYLSLL